MTRLLGLPGRVLKLTQVGKNCKSIGNKWRCLSTGQAQTKPSTEIDNEDFWIKSPFPDINCPVGVTVPEYLKSTLGPWESATAYECAFTGQKYSFKQVFSMSRSFGAALIQAGLRKGDCVAVVLQNVPEYASILYGTWEAGLICSPVNPNYTPDEILRQLKTCRAKIAVTTPQFLSSIRAAQSSGECPDLKSIVVIGEAQAGCHTFSEMIKVDPTHVRFPSKSEINTVEDISLLPYSSGTTGLPKGVCLTQYNLLSNLMQCAIPELLHRPRLGNQDQERYIALLPFFHAYGMAVFLNQAVYNGAHTLCMPKFETVAFLAAVRRHKPTSLHLVTPLISHLVNSDDYGKEELASVEMILAGAAPIGTSIVHRLLAKADQYIIFREGYGMTELSPVSHVVSPLTKNKKIGSCGQGIPNTISKIVDVSTGKTLPRNERGEICVKGPQVMKGYYNNEEATRNTIDSDGWLHTGDIGYFDEDGFCYIVDRLKELIKVKGFQVAPSELEDLLRKHELVTDVAVIGVPNEDWGEVPRAYIVRKNESFTAEDINLYLKDKVAAFKQLRGGIEFVSEIPKSAAGKILRRELSQRYKEQNGIPL